MDADDYISLPLGPPLGVKINEKLLAEEARKPQTSR